MSATRPTSLRSRLACSLAVVAVVASLGVQAAAQSYINRECPAVGGTTGCFYCPHNQSPGGAGCTAGLPPVGSVVSPCLTTRNALCTETGATCGNYVYCNTQKLIGPCYGYYYTCTSP
jgi:hypothetical protein